MTKMLVLASGSETKAKLLRQLGLEFETCKPEVDETPIILQEAPRILAERLSFEKADDVLVQITKKSQAIEPIRLYIIGTDQTITVQAEDLSYSTRYKRFKKPTTKEEAVEQLMSLQGRTHTLITGVCVIYGTWWPPAEKPECRLDALFNSRFASRQHSMKMHPLTREQAIRYVEADNPLYCLGSYKIESLGISLFSDISGPDYTTIIGLPLTCVQELLRETGFFDHGQFPM